jgi:hypothetical protein
MIVKQSGECELAGETKILGGNLPQCYFVYHKPHMTWQGSNLRRRVGERATNSLSYGMAINGG